MVTTNLRRVDEKEYFTVFNTSKKSITARGGISTPRKCDAYFALGSDSYVGVDYYKKGVVRINGLFSFKKGSGKELLETLIHNFRQEDKNAITLNCTKALKDSFYKPKDKKTSWYFKEVWGLLSQDYYELVLFL